MLVKGTIPEVNVSKAPLDALKVKVMQIIHQLNLLGKPFNIHSILKVLVGNEAS